MATSIHFARPTSSASDIHTSTLQPGPTPNIKGAIHSLDPSQSAGVKRRVLLVDDDADIRSLVRAFLETEGFEVFSCGDGHRASHLFRTRNDIDLLLTDVQMPEISGIVLAHQLTELRPSLPVVLMSGTMQTVAIESLIASNGWRFLAKPFQVPQLLDTVHELLASNSSSA